MDSPTPPSRVTSQRKLRPWYLVPGMALTWCVGVQSIRMALASMAFLRQGTLPDVATATASVHGVIGRAAFASLWDVVAADAILRHTRIVFPLSVAQLLLGSMLVICSGMTVSGRRGARSLTVQILAANAVLAAVAYALTRGVRVDCIETVARFLELRSTELSAVVAHLTRDVLWWSLRAHLILIELLPLAAGVWILTRARTKLYLDAVARAAEGAEDP